MALPVSMEDTELFPKAAKQLDLTPGTTYDPSAVKEMLSSLSPLWWSRLLISTRGFTINLLHAGDELTLFTVDDAFTAMHARLVGAPDESNGEERRAEREKFIAHIYTIVGFPAVSTALAELARGAGASAEDTSPFVHPSTSEAFTTVFGAPNEATYRIADGQKHAYLVFSRILSLLQARWAQEKGKKKIRFETDPEWQPDNRVVLFEEFGRGNRTWVLLDFDRHILRFWRPRGAAIIFGDRFVEKKKREGLRLCDVCGMLEQGPSQFKALAGFVLCSPECAEEAAKTVK
ncbi:hypothetical protein PFISCL1PPCAC_22927 [Pristionchus fissidentatus]|uniref:DUF8117 domain-containing protein n=1 Tax=Pristionchus fissidentatus TaxID=1538716 RepID=A0AAV5WM13_9BILA|nr:hypothetical protein PFISCL1PPCAC_22927 [Pristionchus fissidentatus]